MGGQDFGSQPLGLGGGPLRQIGAAQALGKAQIVLNARTGARLAAGGLPVNHQRAQPLGRTVDGCPQAGWAGTHDNHVVEGLRGLGLQTALFGQGQVVGLDQHIPIREKHRWQPVSLRVKPLDQRLGLPILFNI